MNPVLRCCVVLVALFAALPGTAQTTTPIASVRTWGDLRAQPPVHPNSAAIEISPLPTCRIGINLSGAKLYGAAVIYCLVEGATPKPRRDTDLGPFQVEVDGPAPYYVHLREQRMEVVAQPLAGAKPTGEVLYMRTVPFSQPGDYTITVNRPVGGPPGTMFEIDATTTLKVSNQPGPLWSPWPLNAAEGAVGLLAADNVDDRTTGASGVANPSTGVAIPKMPTSFAITQPGAPGPDQLLPEVFPSEPDPGLRLQAVGSLLIVSLDHGIYPSYPDEKFLTRWWVNGQPFTPKLAAPQFSSNYFMRHNGMMLNSLATTITFEVEFHPEFLGAKKGDSIGVQLLLCPQGSQYSGPDPQQMQLSEWQPTTPDLRTIEPRLSNRVTFPYTGDPLRMSPQP